MQYSHTYAVELGSTRYSQQWPVLLADTQRILLTVGQLGIGVCGPDGFGPPLLDTEQGIAFNGDAATGRHGTPLQLPAPLRHGHPTPVRAATCRTALHPYDLAVTAVLLRAHLLLGDEVAIASHGDWDRDWTRGPRPGTPGPRRLVADLFGDCAARSPLLASTCTW